MTISIDWSTKIISIQQVDLTFISTGLYSLDVNSFRLALKNLEDDLDGMTFQDTHSHNTEVTISGVTLARVFQIINGYTVTFQDTGTPYSVKCIGANHNIGDVKNVNNVSLIVGNSAGLIATVSGSGVTEQDKLDIASAVRLNLSTELARVDVGVSTRLASIDFSTSAAPTSADNAAAVRLNLATELSRIDTPISTRLPTSTYNAAPSAVDNATAVWAKAVEGLTAEEMLRVMLAALAGKRQGLGTNTEQYMAQDGITPRVTLSNADVSGNGTPTINGTV